MSALLYLRVMSLTNLILARARRLKQPKYLIGALVGGGYLYMVLSRRAGSGGVPAGLPVEQLEVLGSVAVLVFAFFAWVLPTGRAGLAFSEAEIAFLFPAPLSRTTLVLHNLLGAQLRTLLSATFVMLFTRRTGFGGNAFSHALALWLVFSTINLHTIGANFAVTRLMDEGLTPWRRRGLVLAIAAAALGGATFWVRRELDALALTDFRNWTQALEQLVSTGPVMWVLAPTRLLVAPLFAPDSQAFLVALGPALLVFAAHFGWVLRSALSFEDASIAKAEKRAAVLAARREGKWSAQKATQRRSDPFPLPAIGRPELAFLWKNLLALGTLFRARTFVVLATLIVAGCRWLGRDPESPALAVVASFALMVLLYTLLLGAQFARQDLRDDLPNADILKTYPLRGWQVVLGELLTPTAVLTGVVWLALLSLACSLSGFGSLSLPASLVAPGFIAAALASPLLCALQLLVPNAAALIFPAWFVAMSNHGERGFEVVGQRLLFVAGRLLALVLALVPAALVAVAAWFGTQWLLGTLFAFLLAAAAVLGVLCVELWLGVRWLGACFEHFDLSAELRP